MNASEFHGIGWAVKQMRHGSRVSRAGWNGRGMWLGLVTGAQWDLSPDLEPRLSNQGPLAENGYGYRGSFIAMRAADGMLVPWLCSQSDLLAIDWRLFDGGEPVSGT